MGRPVSQAAVFIALKPARTKGLVASRLDEPDNGRGPALLQRDAGRARGGRGPRPSTRGSGEGIGRVFRAADKA